MFNSFTHNNVRITRNIGAEGPSYDPYGYDELEVTITNPDGSVRVVELHTGLGDWVKLNGEDVDVEHDYKQCVAKFEELTGNTYEYWMKYAATVEYEQFLSSLTQADREFIHVEDLEECAESFVRQFEIMPDEMLRSEHEEWKHEAYRDYCTGPDGITPELENWYESSPYAVMVTAIESSQIAKCRKGSHELVDDSYGGPDSGYMGAHCKRCGESWGSHLY